MTQNTSSERRSGRSRTPGNKKRRGGPVSRRDGHFTSRSSQSGRGRRRRSFKGRSKGLDVSVFINKAVAIADKPVQPFTPKHCFADFAIDERLKAAIAERKFIHPTPIQDEIIPHILNGKDVVGLANTGTGKTAAFLIPLINKLLSNPSKRVLVLSPTRELALQIDKEFCALAKQLRLRSVACVGGAPIIRQIRALRSKVDCIIGTPGRVIDLIKRGNINLARTCSIVLDEADRMLDMGFINDMRFIMECAPRDRHTLFLSATMSPAIKALVNDFLSEPVTVSVKTQDVSRNIEQDVVKVAGRNKTDLLIDHLTRDEFDKVIVFGRTKYGVEKLSVALNKKGIRAESLHGNKTHPQRQRALKKFKDGFARALIATDVAARGLDISGVTHVINYDLPACYDDYIHRIGRTGRGASKGKALTFVE